MTRSSLLAGGLALALVTPAAAREPLAIPPWATLSIEPSGAVEVGGTLTLVIRLGAEVGEVRGAPPTLEGPGGVEVLGAPVPPRAQTARPGAPVEWQVRARLGPRPPEIPLVLRVPARCPVPALRARAEELHAGAHPLLLRGLVDRVLALPPDQVLHAAWLPDVLPEEGSVGPAGPRLRRYLTRGAGTFVVWDPPARAGEGAAARAMATANPRLRALLARAGAAPAPSPAAGYRDALARLEEGAPAAVVARDLAGLALAGPLDPLEAFGISNLRALVDHDAGRVDAALRGWRRLASDPTLGHYAHFNRGEALRLRGDPTGAATAYRRALARHPAYTLARRRLRELAPGSR